MLGYAKYAQVQNSYSEGFVIDLAGAGNPAGGLIGSIGGSGSIVRNSYTDSKILCLSVATNCGGLIGNSNFGPMETFAGNSWLNHSVNVTQCVADNVSYDLDGSCTTR